MHEHLKSIKPLLKAGEYEKAAEALKEYRKEFPDDWDGKLMEGIIAKLRGDEETFLQIRNKAKDIMAKHDKNAIQIQESPLWKKYHSSRKKTVIIITLVLLVSGVIGGMVMVVNRINSSSKIIADFFQSLDFPYPGDIHRQEHPISPDSNTLPKEVTK